MAIKNDNYEETDDGWVRKENAPIVKGPSHINWGRVQSVNNARQGVQDLREKQNQRNEEHRRKHAQDESADTA